MVEMITRVLTGTYVRPYSEYPELKLDFQVINAIMDGKRPTLPVQTPSCLKALVDDCWNHNPTQRPDIISTQKRLQEIQTIFKSDLEVWIKLVYKVNE